MGSCGFSILVTIWEVIETLHDITQRLQCSSFLVMTPFPLRDCNLLPKKELHLSLRVYTKTLGIMVLLSIPALPNFPLG